MSRRDQGRLRRLRVIPIPYRTARAFLRTHRPDLVPPQGHKFSLGLTQTTRGGHLVGVAMVSRPAARSLDDGLTAQLTRLCTDAPPHACSALLAAAWRVAHAMGHQKMITYVAEAEPGTSLSAQGWRQVAQRAAPSRPRSGASTTAARVLWQVTVVDHTRRPDPTPSVSPPSAGVRLPDGGTR